MTLLLTLLIHEQCVAEPTEVKLKAEGCPTSKSVEVLYQKKLHTFGKSVCDVVRFYTSDH